MATQKEIDDFLQGRKEMDDLFHAIVFQENTILDDLVSGRMTLEESKKFIPKGSESFNEGVQSRIGEIRELTKTTFER